MKRYLAIIVAALLMLTACSPGGTASPAASSTPTAQQPTAPAATETPAEAVKLTIFQSKVEIVDQLEAVAKSYTETTGVEVEVWGSAGDDYRSQLQARMAGGEGPVIFSLGGETELNQFSQYVTDLTGQPYVANISAGLELGKDGKIYGVPYGVEGYGLVANLDLIDPAADLQNLDTLTAMFDRLSADGKAPLLLSSENYFLIAHILNTPFALQADFHDFLNKLNAGEVKMADEPLFKEFAQVMELIKSKSANPLEITYDSQIASFADGSAAAIHQGNWAYGMFKDYEVPFQMTLAHLPIGGNQKIAVGVGSYWCINADATDAQKQAAHDFYNYLFNTEEGMNILINEFGFIPPFTNANYTTGDPLSQVVFEYVKKGETLPWTYAFWPQGIIDTALAPAAQGFFSDPGMNGQQFLESLDEAWANAAK